MKQRGGTLSQTLHQLREARQELAERIEVALLRQEVEQLQSVAQPLSEHWDPVPARQWDFAYSDPRQHASLGQLGSPWSRIQDREDGRWIPVYETERDLALLRGTSRSLAAFTSTATGALETLTNYVIGTGLEVTAVANERTVDRAERDSEFIKGLLLRVGDVLEQFFDDNNFGQGSFSIGSATICESSDREMHKRSREDGEAFIALHPRKGGRVKVCFLEPDQVTEPANKRQLEDYLGVSDLESHWEFGVHTVVDGSMRCHDVANPLGYHVIHDGIGRDWDYIPSRRMVHIKRNVGANAKRGVGDFVAVQNDMERESKLRRNTAEGAAIHAAIVGIREHVPGATKSSIESFAAAQIGRDVEVANDDTTSTVRRARFDRPQIRDIPANMKWHAGPLGSLNSPIFIEVAGYLLRSLGNRWQMPEYMISGDASNANLASTLVSESPFVKARSDDQAMYARAMRSLAWKVLFIAWSHGRFDDSGLSFVQLRRLVKLKVDAPEVATRDMATLATTNHLLNQMGIKSRRTIAIENDLDYDEERVNMESESPALPGGSQPSLTLPGGSVAPARSEPMTEGMLEGEITSMTDDERAQWFDLMRQGYP